MNRRTMCLEVTRCFCLLIYVKCASSIVPAPANVSVTCQNLETVVSWTYSQPLLGPRFRVYISPMPASQGTTEVSESKDLQLNLSRYVWRSLMSSRDVYTVNVSAVSADGQESRRTTSPSFTFNQLHRTVQIHCTLELPPVELQVTDREATITFQNPMKVHPELRWAADHEDSDLLRLSFEVTAENNVTHKNDCSVQDQKCTLNFSLPSMEEEYCFSLNAVLWNSIQYVRFKKEDRICGRPADASDTYMLFLVLLLVSFVVVVCSVCFMVWKAQACVRSSPALPKPLDADFWLKLRENVMDLPSEQVCFISVVKPDPSAGGAEDHRDEGGVEQPEGAGGGEGGEEHPGAEGGEEHPGAEGGEEHPGAERGEEHPGAEGGEEHPGAEGGEEHPGAEGGEEHPGAEGGEEHPGAEPEERFDQGYEPRGFPLVPVDMGGGDMVLGYGS